jgi:hypothetical protein
VSQQRWGFDGVGPLLTLICDAHHERSAPELCDPCPVVFCEECHTERWVRAFIRHLKSSKCRHQFHEFVILARDRNRPSQGSAQAQVIRIASCDPRVPMTMSIPRRVLSPLNTMFQNQNVRLVQPISLAWHQRLQDSNLRALQRVCCRMSTHGEVRRCFSANTVEFLLPTEQSA